jgi:hypothetical protein
MFATEGWSLHVLTIVLMTTMVGLNHLIAHHRTERRYALEANRLRSALISELGSLHDFYRMNLELIERKEDFLMSVRSPTQIYRSNLGRITSLFETSVVDDLVSVFARNELIEGLLAAHATSKGGISYQLTPKSKIDDLKKGLAEGVNHIAGMRYALGQNNRKPQSSYGLAPWWPSQHAAVMTPQSVQ